MTFATNKSLIGLFGFVLFCVYFLSVPVDSKLKNLKKLKFCKWDHFIQKCGIDQTLQLTSTQNGSGIANTQDELDQFCYTMVHYFPACTRHWMSKCATDLHTEAMMKILVDEKGTYVKAFCDRNGYIRNEFLKYSNCLIHHVKLSPSYRKECIRPLQAAGEMIHNREMASKRPSFGAFARDTCCAYNKWENCILKHLTDNCGQPSADVFPYLIRYSSNNLVNNLCTRLKFDVTNTAVCKEENYVAPANFKPLGYHSKSALSYAFSWGCPNVGWGIVPDRDW